MQAVARWEKDQIKEGMPGPAQGLIRLLYEEHTKENKKIMEPLKRLAELDEIMNEEGDETINFVDALRDMEWIASLIDARAPKPGPRAPYKKRNSN